MEFHEIQRTPKGLKIFFWVILVVTSLFGALWTFLQWQTGILPDMVGIAIALGSMIGVPVLLVLWLNLIKQYVTIDEHGVTVQQKGLMWKPKVIAWADVTSASLRRMDPFGEFGGWGIRYGYGGKWGYILDGKYGLELTLRKGKPRVISIVDGQGAGQALHALGKVA